MKLEREEKLEQKYLNDMSSDEEDDAIFEEEKKMTSIEDVVKRQVKVKIQEEKAEEQ